MNDKKSLYIFLHISRTAGTTFIKQIEDNYKKSQLFRLYHNEMSLKSDRSYYITDYKKITTKLVNKLSKEQRKEIRVIYGHRVWYGIHELFEKKPYYITFLRDPIERIKSLYNLWFHSYKTCSPGEKDSDKFKYGLLVNGEVPNFSNWIINKVNRDESDIFDITLTSFFSKLGYLDDKDGAGIKKLLLIFNHIGFTDNYLRSYFDLSGKMNLQKLAKSENISKNKYVESLAEKEVRYIKKLLKDDYLIYEYALKILQKNTNITTIEKLSYISKLLSSGNNPRTVLREVITNLV